MRDRLGATPRASSGSVMSDRRATMPGSDDDERFAVADEDDARGRALARVAGMEQVNGRHDRR